MVTYGICEYKVAKPTFMQQSHHGSLETYLVLIKLPTGHTLNAALQFFFNLTGSFVTVNRLNMN